ncbi:uncharacterized protein LOC141856334 [Brevipalpus obovatus]|uniref:uncharacterized protein LOC141856334 n=1 Tax=Brevipalpus obovatus TaxID=246614 RepID=UPI003D9F996D
MPIMSTGPSISTPNEHSSAGLQSQNTSSNGINTGGNNPIKGTIERGASWSFNETRLLLSLWGQDMVQRQLTNSKRTRHVWETIAKKIRDHGFERTPDQVRTRVFNMIAEYRRILKNPTPERKKKCIFFDALHRIYQAKDVNAVRAALNYDDDYNFYNDTMDFTMNDETSDGAIADGGDGENSGTDNEEIFAYQMSPSQTLNGPNATNGATHLSNDYEGDQNHSKRFKSQQASSQVPSYAYNTYDGSLTVLIDRMFSHLSKESEIMKDWIKLERERADRDAQRRKEEQEREERLEKLFMETLTKMQEQTFNFLANFTGVNRNQSATTNTLPSTEEASKVPSKTIGNPSSLYSILSNSTSAHEFTSSSSNQPFSSLLSQPSSACFNQSDNCSQLAV